MTSESTAKHPVPLDSSAPQYGFVVTTQSVAAGSFETLYPVALLNTANEILQILLAVVLHRIIAVFLKNACPPPDFFL